MASLYLFESYLCLYSPCSIQQHTRRNISLQFIAPCLGLECKNVRQIDDDLDDRKFGAFRKVTTAMSDPALTYVTLKLLYVNPNSVNRAYCCRVLPALTQNAM